MRPQDQTFPPSGNASQDQVATPQSAPETGGVESQDEVKLQWNSTEQIPVYQFVNQHGSLILQVPSEQMVNLARDISQEFAEEAAPKAATRAVGGKENGR